MHNALLNKRSKVTIAPPPQAAQIWMSSAKVGRARSKFGGRRGGRAVNRRECAIGARPASSTN